MFTFGAFIFYYYLIPTKDSGIIEVCRNVSKLCFFFQTSMTCCGVGFMLGRAFSHGGSTQLKALLETYTPGA